MKEEVKTVTIGGLYLYNALRIRKPVLSRGLIGVERVLFVELLGIGDAVNTLPAVTNIKRALPRSEIWFLCTRASGEVLRHCEHIDRLVLCGGHKDAVRFRDLLYLLRLESPDITLVTSWSVKNSLASCLVASKLVAGYLRDHSLKGLYFNDYHVEAVGLPLRGETVYRWNEHISDRANRVLCALGIPIEERIPHLPHLPLPPEIDEPYALLCLGAVWEGRRWQEGRWTELATKLKKSLRLEPIFIWGPGESAYGERARGEFRGSSPPLQRLLNLIQHARVVISHDSGPMHISSALGTPTVGLLGPNLPEICGPRYSRSVSLCARLDCSPCQQRYCPRPPGDRCMDRIEVEEVLVSVRELMRS